MSFAPFNNPWRNAPAVPYSSSDSGITLLPAPSHPPLQNGIRPATSIGLCWFRPPLQRRDRSRLSRDSLISHSWRTQYSVLPHKALPTKNIVNNSGHCHPMSCPSPNGHLPFMKSYFRGFHSASAMPATIAAAPINATAVIFSSSAITAVIIVTSGIA